MLTLTRFMFVTVTLPCDGYGVLTAILLERTLVEA